ncbi:MAG: triple tyrosine motif-containing protein, partial [Muriicola sp.]
FLETEDGAIWIASASSLIRYDGEHAFTYDYPFVYKITIDQHGRLWMVKPGQSMVLVLDFKNDIEYTITISDNFVPLDILSDHTGTIYIVSIQDGLYKMDPGMKSLQKVANEGTNLSWTLFEDSKDNLWIGFGDRIAIVDKERKELKTFPGNSHFDVNSIVSDIKEDRSGNIWLCLPFPSTANKSFSPSLLRVSLKNQKVRVLNAENGYNILGNTITEDTQGNFWVFGRSEAFILNENTTNFKILGLKSILMGNQKRPLPLKRKDGSLWIATTDKGVVIANDFTLKTEYFDEARGLINSQVWEIEENSRGELWLGTRGGINIIDPKKNTIKALSHEILHSTTPNNILYIKEISKDRFFIDASGGFSILDRENNKITLFANDPNTMLRVRGVTIIDDHTFFIYSSQGLFLFDIESNTVKKFISKTNPEVLNLGVQARMYYDGKEILWMPTQDGLAKVNMKMNTVSFLNEEKGLCSNDGTVLSMSNEGELWLATESGIGILNLEENTLTNIKEENGLIPAELYDLIEKGDLMYAASVDGLIPIKKATAKTSNQGYYTFNSGLGFKSNDYLEGSAKFLYNGQFWSGVSSQSSEYKLLVLDAAPRPDTTTSHIFITDIFVMDEEPGFKENSSIDSLNINISSNRITKQIKWDSITHPYSIPFGLELPHDQNSLSFSYGSSDLFNRDQLTYRFILEGEDEDWTYAASSTKTKNYYNLTPGKYIFKVSSRSFNNEWSTPDTLE